jgi:hypothetical protein
MKPEERSMILDLFDRIAAAPQDNIDREADQVIRDAVARNPNAPYVLVQTALIQEEALRRADERIRQLQDAASAGGADRDTSFLGSGRRLGGGSVPNAGVRQSAAPDSFSRPDDSRYAPMPGQPVPVPPQPMQAAGGGGGFLSSALTTAGGVAGGMLLADGIRGLFGGSHGSDLWGRTAEAQPSTPANSDSNSVADQDRAQDAKQDADDDQDAAQDADDDDQDDGGWDDSDSIDA